MIKLQGGLKIELNPHNPSSIEKKTQQIENSSPPEQIRNLV
jgi:hypothetical protein